LLLDRRLEAARRTMLGCDPRGYSFRTSSGNFAMLAAIRRASSFDLTEI